MAPIPQKLMIPVDALLFFPSAAQHCTVPALGGLYPSLAFELFFTLKP